MAEADRRLANRCIRLAIFSEASRTSTDSGCMSDICMHISDTVDALDSRARVQHVKGLGDW